jgi:hypothetical protein
VGERDPSDPGGIPTGRGQDGQGDLRGRAQGGDEAETELKRAAILLGAALAWSGVAAQEPDPFGRGPSTASIGIDSVLVVGGVHPAWRHLELGRFGASALVDVALAGRPVTAAGSWGLSASVGGTAVLRERPAAASSGHVEGGVLLAFHPDPGALAFVGSVSAYHLPSADAAASGVEVGLGVRRIRVPWGLEEVDPELGLALYNDWGRFDALRAEADLHLGLGVQNVAFWVFRDVSAWVGGRLAWSDYRGTESFGGRAGLGTFLDWGLGAVGIGFGAQDPIDVDGLRAWTDLTIRIWPQARPL